MTLSELIMAVKEKNLSKDQLESYRDQMSSLYAEMQIELAEVEKNKALFFEENQYDNRQTDTYTRNTILYTDIAKKRLWQASEKGQREIVLKRYCLATKELLNSLKSRLYSIY